ncbi:hypothetical protein KBA73_02140 [Patescibacteria group bacterium]|jgi:hypothetical protein|nr:hypothetical protein [Patescibacteria group bacterium]
MFLTFFHKHHLTVRVLPWLLVIAFLKYLLMHFEWQPIALSALVTAAVSADVFLLGFLIAGSLPEYKEAERLPGEVAASLDAITDECLILRATKPTQPESVRCLEQLLALIQSIKQSLHKKASTGDVMQCIRNLNESFAAFEPLTQANFIVRLKQEQQNIRRLMLRIRTIREVAFVSTGYAIGEVFTLIIVTTLLLTSMGSTFVNFFFCLGLSYLLIYMIELVKDLDNPFHYRPGISQHDETDCTPIEAVERKIRAEIQPKQRKTSRARAAR